jgi:hypothetical protein
MSFVPRRYILRQVRKFVYATLKVSFELLNFLDQGVKLGDRVEIRKHSVLDEAEKPEAEPKEKYTAVLQVDWKGLGLTEAGIKLFEDIEWNEQLAVTTEQGIARMCA